MQLSKIDMNRRSNQTGESMNTHDGIHQVIKAGVNSRFVIQIPDGEGLEGGFTQ